MKNLIMKINENSLISDKLISKKIAFTMIEIIVSITIFWIISIAIFSVYITSNDITMKSDINRIMQENAKNISSRISEDIRKNWILWVSWDSIDDCNFDMWWDNYKHWDKLCTKSWNIYYLAKFDQITWSYLRVNSSQCWGLEDQCIIAQWIDKPLTNSYVTVRSIEFSLSKDYTPKVTMNIVLQPTMKKWVKIDLIKNSILNFQTTVSERPF